MNRFGDVDAVLWGFPLMHGYSTNNPTSSKTDCTSLQAVSGKIYHPKFSTLKSLVFQEKPKRDLGTQDCVYHALFKKERRNERLVHDNKPLLGF